MIQSLTIRNRCVAILRSVAKTLRRCRRGGLKIVRLNPCEIGALAVNSIWHEACKPKRREPEGGF